MGTNKSTGWGVYENTDSIHVLPVNEYDQHSSDGIEGLWCKCKPRSEKTKSRILIVHNSFDQREIVEQAREILKANSTDV